MYSGTANSLSNLLSGNIDPSYTKKYSSTTSSTTSSSTTSSININDTASTTSAFINSITTDRTVSKETGTYLGDSKKYAENLASDIESLDPNSQKNKIAAISSDSSSSVSSTDKLVKNMTSFVDDYNNLLKTSKSYSDSGSARLNKQLSSTASVYSKSLSKLGITVGTDGSMTINKDKLKTAAEDGSLTDFIKDNKSNASYGLFNKVDTIANNIKSNSTYYLSSKQQNNISYSNNISDTVTTKSYFSKLAFNYNVVGTLVNSWF